MLGPLSHHVASLSLPLTAECMPFRSCSGPSLKPSQLPPASDGVPHHPAWGGLISSVLFPRWGMSHPPRRLPPSEPGEVEHMWAPPKDMCQAQGLSQSIST